MLARHSQVFQAITDAVLVTDLTGRVVDCNPAAEATYGLPRARLVGGVLGQLGISRVPVAFEDFLARVRRDGAWSADMPIRRGDGEPRLVASHVLPITDTDGQLVGVATIAHDVTEERRARSELAQAERTWRLTFDGAPVGLAVVMLDGTFKIVNNALCVMLGYSEQVLLTMTFQELTHPADLDRDLSRLAELISGVIESYTLEKRYIHAQGHEVWAEIAVSLISDPLTEEPLHYVAQIEETTARRSAREHQAALVAAQLAIAAVELSPAKVGHQICEQAVRLTRASAATIEIRDGQHMVYRATSDDARAHLGMRQPVDGSFSGLSLEQDRTLVCADSDTDGRVDAAAARAANVRSIVAVPLRHADTVLGVLKVGSERAGHFTEQDVASLEVLAAPFANTMANARRMELTSEQAVTDPLTGLANRGYALHELRRALERQERHGGHCAVVFIDLDGFKAVNDTLGHAAGDLLLIEVAARLRRAVRATDLPARYGGDEFLIVCEAMTTPDDITVLAQRLSATLPGRYLLGGHPIPQHTAHRNESDAEAHGARTDGGGSNGGGSDGGGSDGGGSDGGGSGVAVTVGASIGIAVADRPVDPTRLLQAADQLMYEAKRSDDDRPRIGHIGA